MNLPFGLNWVDLVILLVIIYFVVTGLMHGFWNTLSNFLAFLGAMLIALKLYPYAGAWMSNAFNMSSSTANAVGFLIIAIVAEVLLGIAIGLLFKKIPKDDDNKVLRAASIIPSLGESMILVAFILTLIMIFPISPRIKRDISASKVGGYVLTKTGSVENSLSDAFGGVVEESLTFVTIKPDSNETVTIDVGEVELSSDFETEKEMLTLLNNERKKQGVEELAWSEELAVVARAHATDMWERKYFGHISLEGENVGDRLDEEKVDYTLAGENLAMAPTVETAHNGLMNSTGHRENILESDYKLVGIGVIDNGIYGKMFVQVFLN